MKTCRRLPAKNTLSHRTFWRCTLCSSVLILACTLVLSAQQNGLSPEKRQEIEKAVASFLSANSVPGLAAAVVLEGEPRWSQGFGMADLENYSAATSSALFRLGSISKPTTS